MFDDFERKNDYNLLMKNLIEENKCYMTLIESRMFRTELTKKKIKKAIKKFDFNMARNFFEEVKTQYRLKESGINNEIVNNSEDLYSNYFSKDRIAIYTCIFGKYDSIQEPMCIPDNCDYYIITDLQLSKSSLWKPIQIDESKFEIENMTAAEKNRFFKMHPHLLFPEYDYSIYVDGNIKIIADPTAFVNRIGKWGIAMHSHSRRECVYDEITACDIYRREPKESLERQKKLLHDEGLPKKYGMCECNIIARRHNDEKVITMMEQWWTYYRQYAKRDQLSWPLVLYKNGIKTSEITTLGSNVGRNYSVRIVRHELMQKV